jgi:hypothetical protein
VTDTTDGRVNRISYGIWPAWGIPAANGTVYILIQCDELFKIIVANPSTGQWGDIALPASFQGSDATWSHSVAEEIYHRDGGSRLMLLNVLTWEDTVVWDAAKWFPNSPYLARMSSSSDDTIWCFERQDINYNPSGFVVVNLATLELYSEPPSRAGQGFKVQIDAAGKFMWNVATDPNSEFWNLGLPNIQAPLASAGTGHAAMLSGAIVQYDNATDQDALRQGGSRVGQLVTLDWSQIGSDNWSLSTEYSPFTRVPGYYACTAAALPSAPLGELRDELILISTDGSGAVMRLCHMYNLQTSDYGSIPQPTGGYANMPTLAPIVAFHSSYGATDGNRQVFLALCEPPAAPLVNRRVGLPDRRMTQLPGY